ncbi:MAG: dephospho-CoA kinase [Oscillospiraceae bacterium]|nr:dephospho-CoA kinase [Oscillospiraceae bacterium]
MLNLPKIMIIGLTGMSGAGKSTVCEVFKERGFSVVDCDKIARETAKKQEFLEELSERFSKELLNPDGSLNRGATAKLIYNDEQARGKYQRIIFPYIIHEIICEIKRADGTVVLDAPTLFESGADILCTKIVSVAADVELCVGRITERDKITSEQARERISSQHNAEYFKANSDYYIENNKTAAELREHAVRITDKIKGELWK